VSSDLTARRSRSVLLPLNEASRDALEAALRAVGDEALADLGDPAAGVEYALDLRYQRQSYELTVELGGHPAIEGARASFDALHEARYAHHDPAASVEVVNARATARVPSTFEPVKAAAPTGRRRKPGRAQVCFDGRELETRVYEREQLRPGERVEGPALVLQLDSTTLVEPGWAGLADEWGNLVLERA
jgi:N-methylhydantoinase A